MAILSHSKRASAAFVLCLATVVASPAQTFTSLTNFDGSDGAVPWYMSLIQGLDGHFYGTTALGGKGCPSPGCGTAFRIDSKGKLTTVNLSPGDGSDPVASLLLTSNGNFYGTTYHQGANGYGTVFEISKSGKLTVVYDFCLQPNCVDGSSPQAPLVRGTDGNFYGTTQIGGDNRQGTVFKITSQGALTTLHSFAGYDGSEPVAGLVQASDGTFYGTTSQDGPNGYGTLFQISANGTFETLHGFEGTDGKVVLAGLTQAADGNLYGTASEGGAKGYGTIFAITPAGALTTLYSFCSLTGCADGENPDAGLIQATDGNFYGTTNAGGAHNGGTVFSVTSQGVLTTLHSFDVSDGNQPFGGLLQATDGAFYGATHYGGNLKCNAPSGCGTIYNLDMGLGPFVAFIQAAGKVGQTGGILGQGFTGTTSVSFNGTTASFMVVSDTFINATVPAGATTGFVSVATPSGTLTSNVPFHVLK
jgi:uncharacterized repeat protein (TIGR03803 family)